MRLHIACERCGAMSELSPERYLPVGWSRAELTVRGEKRSAGRVLVLRGTCTGGVDSCLSGPDAA